MAAKAKLAGDIERLAELQERLYAEHRYAVLIVLQGMDTAGKDGTIKHVMSGVNPSGCEVAPFKVPTEEEAAHDFLWRVHRHAPRRGHITILNRSHYEDVLAPRVHRTFPKRVLRQRYDHINAFERILAENDTLVLKFFLHISKGEQCRRLQARLRDPSKQRDFDYKPQEHHRTFFHVGAANYKAILLGQRKPGMPARRRLHFVRL